MMVDGTHEVYNCKEESTEQSTAPEGKRETCTLCPKTPRRGLGWGADISETQQKGEHEGKERGELGFSGKRDTEGKIKVLAELNLSDTPKRWGNLMAPDGRCKAKTICPLKMPCGVKCDHKAWRNSMQQNKLGANWLKSNFADGDLGDLILSRSMQCVLGSKEQQLHPGLHWQEHSWKVYRHESTPFIWHLWDHICWEWDHICWEGEADKTILIVQTIWLCFGIHILLH